MTQAFYNENDPFPARWLSNLVRAGLITSGVVDSRSICDLAPEDLEPGLFGPITRVHLFAGIGGWDLALQLADWPVHAEVWTASCPCQPFSGAGKGKGLADERHLWPEAFRLIRERRPAVVMGEQVASPAGLDWLDHVFDDLEGSGYTCRAADLCAAGVGAPHIRQRLWWRADRVADDCGPGLEGHYRDADDASRRPLEAGPVATGGAAGDLADAGRPVLQPRQRSGDDAGTPASVEGEARQRQRGGAGDRHGRAAGELADADGRDSGQGGAEPVGEQRQHPQDRDAGRQGGGGTQPVPSGNMGGPGPVYGFWSAADWLRCRDERWRPVEPGSFPLADGLPGGMVRLRSGRVTHRAGALRGFGNAIVPQVAAAFIELTGVPT